MLFSHVQWKWPMALSKKLVCKHPGHSRPSFSCHHVVSLCFYPAGTWNVIVTVRMHKQLASPPFGVWQELQPWPALDYWKSYWCVCVCIQNLGSLLIYHCKWWGLGDAFLFHPHGSEDCAVWCFWQAIDHHESNMVCAGLKDSNTCMTARMRSWLIVGRCD